MQVSIRLLSKKEEDSNTFYKRLLEYISVGDDTISKFLVKNIIDQLSENGASIDEAKKVLAPYQTMIRQSHKSLTELTDLLQSIR